ALPILCRRNTESVRKLRVSSAGSPIRRPPPPSTELDTGPVAGARNRRHHARLPETFHIRRRRRGLDDAALLEPPQLVGGHPEQLAVHLNIVRAPFRPRGADRTGRRVELRRGSHHHERAEL